MAFSIQHMDPLGQGVSKHAESITFIEKTLPGESGMARLRKSKKKVQFAQLESLEITADNRIDPHCEHYDLCPGCHYLHTDYPSELQYKKDALLRALRKTRFEQEKLNLVPAPQRSAYRNRIQLHYRQDRIGLIDGLHDTVIEIPQCQIIREELRPALEALYSDKHWQETLPEQGHCELYVKNDKVNVEWNKPYSHGGFTQVNEAMNLQLRDHVLELLDKTGPKSVLDLFSGDGNLSSPYAISSGCKRVMIDGFTGCKHADFLQLDLFKNNALTRFRRDYQRNSFDTLLLDPPRKGFRNIDQWVESFTPKQIVYVSCAPATLARDLAALDSRYLIENLTLLDMFPGTRHFETIVQLRAR